MLSMVNPLTAAETLTVDDLHHHMGHIAPDTAKLLVKKHIIEGIQLGESQNPHTCDACEFVKTSCKAITCEHVADQAKSLVMRYILICGNQLQ
jgi:hypothetical protein